MKKNIASALMIALLLFVTGCDGSLSFGSKKTIDKIINKAQEIQNNTDSLGFDMSILYSFDNGEENVTMAVHADGNMLIKPVIYEMNYSYGIGNYGGMNFLMYMIDNNEQSDIYKGVDYGKGLVWSHEQQELEYDFAPSLQNILNYDIEKYNLIGVETQDDRDLYYIELSLSGKEMSQLLSSINIYEEFGIIEEKLNNKLLSCNDLKVNMWIDVNDCHLLKYEIDLSKSIDGLEMPLYEDYYEICKKLVITFIINDINNVDSIEIPQEALDTPVFDFGLLQ